MRRDSLRAWRKADEALRFRAATIGGGTYKGVSYPGRCGTRCEDFGGSVPHVIQPADLDRYDGLIAEHEAAYDRACDAIPEWAVARETARDVAAAEARDARADERDMQALDYATDGFMEIGSERCPLRHQRA